MRVTAVILAAGRGERMRGTENKAFLFVAGRPLLAHTLHTFVRSPRVDEIVVVVRPGEEARIEALLPEAEKPVSVAPGGDVRRDSAIAGVEAARGEIVLIHDGARPFPSEALIDRIVRGTVDCGACVPVLPVVDTLRPIDGDRLGSRPIDRGGLARMQTPQGFRRSLILRALPLAPREVTDDAGAVLALGEEVSTVPGEATNLKVTVPEDLPLAEAIVERLRRDSR